MYFDWEALFIQPQLQRQKFEQMGLSQEEVVSRMVKILEAQTLIPPAAMAAGVGGGGSTQRGQQDDTENSYVENGYVENYFV